MEAAGQALGRCAPPALSPKIDAVFSRGFCASPYSAFLETSPPQDDSLPVTASASATAGLFLGAGGGTKTWGISACGDARGLRSFSISRQQARRDCSGVVVPGASSRGSGGILPAWLVLNPECRGTSSRGSGGTSAQEYTARDPRLPPVNYHGVSSSRPCLGHMTRTCPTSRKATRTLRSGPSLTATSIRVAERSVRDSRARRNLFCLIGMDHDRARFRVYRYPE